MLSLVLVSLLVLVWCSMNAAELRGSTNHEKETITEKTLDTLDAAMNVVKELDVSDIAVGKRRLDDASSGQAIDVETVTNVNWMKDDEYYYDDYYNDDGYYYDDYYNDDGYYYDDNYYTDDGYYYDDNYYTEGADDGYYYDDNYYTEGADDGYYYDDYYYDDTP